MLTYGNVITNGQHSFSPGDKEIPAVDPASKEWFDYRDVELAPHADVLAGQRCALLYVEGSASSYHMRFGEWAVLVDLSPEDAQDLIAGCVLLTKWADTRQEDLKKAALGQRGGLDLYAEFAYTNESYLDDILKSRKHLPLYDERADSFRREGESSEDWWKRRVTAATSSTWTTKRDGD